jgi:hypothetical protein
MPHGTTSSSAPTLRQVVHWRHRLTVRPTRSGAAWRILSRTSSEWDSVEGHEQGFRRSPEFRDFFALVQPFFNDIEEMRHYQALERSEA